MAQRILWLSKGFSDLQVAHGRNRGLRLSSLGLIQSSSFLSVKREVTEGSGKGHFTPQGPRWGKLEEGSITGDSKRQVKKKKKTLEMERLFLRELCNGNLEGGPLYLGL